MSDEVFFRLLTDELEQRGRLALASVIETRGSGPSRAGRRFLIFEDGRFRGTIGGGPFEALVVADAADLFRNEAASRLVKWYDFFEREINAGEAREMTNMICGGSARVSIEILQAAPALIVLGGGHVGLALARLGLELGYDVTVGDDREEYSAADRFPAGVKALRANRHYEVPLEAIRPGRDLYVAIVTRCWETDLAALRPWLLDEAPRARYLGLIGSRRKVQGVFESLRRKGVSEDRIGRVHAPIGLPIGAVTPEEIAVSILAEMTAVRRRVSNHETRAAAYAPAAKSSS